MNELKTIIVHNRIHVCRFANRIVTKKVPDPNYLGSGMALCGIVGVNETFEDFLKRKR